MVAKAKDSQYNLNCWMSLLTIIGQYIKEKKKKVSLESLKKGGCQGLQGRDSEDVLFIGCRVSILQDGKYSRD